MAAALRSSSNTGNDLNTTTKSPAVPSGAATNDVMVAVLSRWTTATAFTTIPTGFTDWGTTYLSGDSQANVHIFWKRLSGADTGTYTWAWTAGGNDWSHAHVFCASGCATTGNPIEGVNGWAGTAGTFGSTSVTTVTQPLLIWSTYNDTSGTHTPPTSFTEVIDFDSGSAAWRVPGTTGTQTASGGSVTSSSAAAAVLIALKADTGGQIFISQPRLPQAVFRAAHY